MEKKIALSIEEMQNLRKLGVGTSGASLYYFYDALYDSYDLKLMCDGLYDEYSCSPTLTLQEVLELLPETITFGLELHELQLHNKNGIKYSFYDGGCEEEAILVWFINKEELINNAYDALCWCAKNGYLNK